MASEIDRIRELGADVQDQNDLEQIVGRQADQIITGRAKELDQNRLDKAQVGRHKLESQVRKIKLKLSQPLLPDAATVQRLQKEIDHYQTQIADLDRDIRQITSRIKDCDNELEDLASKSRTDGRLPSESQRDFLIRTGKITPFNKLAQRQAKVTADLRETLLDAEQDLPNSENDVWPGIYLSDTRSHVHLKRPGFSIEDSSSEKESNSSVAPGKKRCLKRKGATFGYGSHKTDYSDSEFSATFVSEASDTDASLNALSETEDDDETTFQPDLMLRKRRRISKKHVTRDRQESGFNSERDDMADVDDGNETFFRNRITRWVESRSLARRKARSKQENPLELPESEEWYLPHPSVEDLDLGDGYRIPGDIHPALFDYQKTGVQWLSELYKQKVGGIVGDEMGLGKTVQVISILACLHYSKKINQPVIVVCPATVMKQWVNEFHAWWPAFRVSILHASGSGMMDLRRECREEDALADRLYNLAKGSLTKSEKFASKIVNKVVEEGHVLVTTYAGLQTYAEFLIPIDWGYAVLDEGHKIRNPNASITIHCKELRTANRIILSGTPIQNNLTELWSLFDFVYPMRLGTLVTFRSEFEIPIRMGGYANASNLQVLTAAKCAETLKDSIQPYLLQRLKVDVATDLPKKTEQVLFCKLSEDQRIAYRRFLSGQDMKAISDGKRNPLFGIDILRKICNHPDLVEHKILKTMKDRPYGDPKSSGKMLVVKELLQMWSSGGHKTLLFCQFKLMIDILQKYIESLPGIRYCRMDGDTSIKKRQEMIDDFNNDASLDVFLLTTKTGGLGVNLTGADRVIIFDPDWNPSTDIQARERAWRLGQKRQVQIYRLMMAGTIEEKMFHRQIFKQLLTNKILKDPKQRSNIHMNEIHDLFTLDEGKDGTETGRLFKDSETCIVEPKNENPGEGRSIKPETRSNDSVDPARHVHDLSNPPGESSSEEPDVHKLEGVTSIANTDRADDDQDGKYVESENRLLTGIFARSGVSSTVEHDRIINGKIDYGADQRILQRHAEQVAAKAAISLKRAERLAKETPIGVPTWTGDVGSAGRPSSPERRLNNTRPATRGPARNIGGTGSASILGALRQNSNKQGSVAVPKSSRGSKSQQVSDSNEGNTSGAESAENFGFMIIQFLSAQPAGMAFTEMLNQQFRHRCKTIKQVAEFNAMLKEIATLKKGTNGRGQWTIKPEYRDG